MAVEKDLDSTAVEEDGDRDKGQVVGNFKECSVKPLDY